MYVVCVLIFNFYNVSFIVQGCVFDYKRVDAIKERHAITDALLDVISIAKYARSQWTMKVITKHMPPQKHIKKQRCRIRI